MERSASFINRVFNLRPGDLSRGLPLFTYYLLIVTFYVMGRAARVAIFLDHFKPVQQPYVDISVALLASFIIAPYIRAGRWVSLHNLQTGSLLFFSVNLLGFWWGVHFGNSAWLSTVFYVWVGVCGVLTVAQVWTLANSVWTTREAKRLFGILGSGGIIGGSVGGFLTNRVTSLFGTDAILLYMAAMLPVCAMLIRVIWKQKQTAGPEEPGAIDTEEGPRSLMDSFRLVRQSPHLKAIAALICLSSFVTTLGGWQLNAIAKQTLIHKDAITAFLGNVNLYTGIASLIAQLLITTKLLRRFGVGVALLILPLSLAVGSMAILVWGPLWAATVLKGSDGVFRYSIDTSAVQLLYLPVPARIKVQVKSFIDTVIWKFGDGLAGVTILILATYPHFTPKQVGWVNLVLLGAWIATALVSQRYYVSTLRDNIQQVRIHPEQVSVSVLDDVTKNVFAEKLNSSDVNEVLYALNLFEMAQHLRAHSAVRNLLEHPSPHVRKKAISILNDAGETSALQQIAGLLTDNSLEVRTEALLYLSRHDEMDPLTYVEQLGDFASFSIRSATISFLMRPGEGQNLVAARVITDGMIADLGNPELAADAARALALLGDNVVDALRDQLADSNAPMEVRKPIPELLLRIATSNAALALAENMVQADAELRSRTISALNKLYDFRPDLQLDKQLIETAMIAEIMGHYRSYQIIGASNNGIDESLKQTMAEEIERIFRMMKLMFPAIDLQNAYLGIQSTDPIRHSNALEFLDNTLNPQLRSRLVPLIDSEVTLQERVRLADRFLGFSVPQTET
jgi:AAA family ATP:ADP antiporter